MSFVAAYEAARHSSYVFDPSASFIQLDNEPDIWDSTHRDCHPITAGHMTSCGITRLPIPLQLKAAYPWYTEWPVRYGVAGAPISGEATSAAATEPSMRRTTTCLRSAAHTDPIDRCTASLPPWRALIQSLPAVAATTAQVHHSLAAAEDERVLSQSRRAAVGCAGHTLLPQRTQPTSPAQAYQKLSSQTRCAHSTTRRIPDPGWIGSGPGGCGSWV